MKDPTPVYLKKIKKGIDELEKEDKNAAKALRHVYEGILSKIEGYNDALDELSGIESILSRYEDKAVPKAKVVPKAKSAPGKEPDALDERYQAILDVLKDGPLDGGKIREKLKISGQTFSSRIGRLCKSGKVEGEGKRGHRTYRLLGVPYEAEDDKDYPTEAAKIRGDNLSILTEIEKRGEVYNRTLYSLFENKETVKNSVRRMRRNKLIRKRDEGKKKKTFFLSLTKDGTKYLEKLKSGVSSKSIVLSIDLKKYKPILDLLEKGARPLAEIYDELNVTSTAGKRRITSSLNVLDKSGNVQYEKIGGEIYVGLPGAIMPIEAPKPKKKLDEKSFNPVPYVQRFFDEHPQTGSLRTGELSDYINDNIGVIDKKVVRRSVQKLEKDFVVKKVPEGSGAIKEVMRIFRKEKIVEIKGIPVREKYLDMLEGALVNGYVIEQNEIWAQLNEPDPEKVEQFENALIKHFEKRGIRLNRDKRGHLRA